ncbi:hypothetical protein F4604DRAFT_1497288, partial [Suillus subluteus]
NTPPDLIYFVYSKGGSDNMFIEHQKIKTFGLNNEAAWWMKTDKEYNELLNDYHLLQEFIFTQADSLNPRYLPVNLHCIIQNIMQIFHIDKWKSSDLELAYSI